MRKYTKNLFCNNIIALIVFSITIIQTTIAADLNVMGFND